MNPGTYRVSFLVDFSDFVSQEEAQQAVAEMVSEMIDEDSFPEIEFELVDELDLEYNTEEDELEELNF